MRFNSIEQVLNQLETQPGWEKFRQYRQLLKCWDRVVNLQIAQHTRPLYINRQILYIATDSAARAQELSFQRYTLLKKLNQQLTFQIQDLRFSSSKWHQKTHSQVTQPPLFTIGDRDSKQLDRYKTKVSDNSIASSKSANRRETHSKGQNPVSSQDKAKKAALDWLKSIEQRASSAVFCPKCKAATSKEELARWNLCHHCVAQQWSEEYSPPTFPSGNEK